MRLDDVTTAVRVVCFDGTEMLDDLRKAVASVRTALDETKSSWRKPEPRIQIDVAGGSVSLITNDRSIEIRHHQSGRDAIILSLAYFEDRMELDRRDPGGTCRALLDCMDRIAESDDPVDRRLEPHVVGIMLLGAERSILGLEDQELVSLIHPGPMCRASISLLPNGGSGHTEIVRPDELSLLTPCLSVERDRDQGNVDRFRMRPMCDTIRLSEIGTMERLQTAAALDAFRRK
jgi:hypothetical protein